MEKFTSKYMRMDCFQNLLCSLLQVYGLFSKYCLHSALEHYWLNEPFCLEVENSFGKRCIPVQRKNQLKDFFGPV